MLNSLEYYQAKTAAIRLWVDLPPISLAAFEPVAMLHVITVTFRSVGDKTVPDSARSGLYRPRPTPELKGQCNSTQWGEVTMSLIELTLNARLTDCTSCEYASASYGGVGSRLAAATGEQLFRRLSSRIGCSICATVRLVMHGRKKCPTIISLLKYRDTCIPTPLTNWYIFLWRCQC